MNNVNTGVTQSSQPVQREGEPSLEGIIETLQAVVTAQKAQIDTLLVSLESLLASLDSSPQPQPPVLCASMDSAWLGNPQDPQFASLHQLMARLKLA